MKLENNSQLGYYMRLSKKVTHTLTSLSLSLSLLSSPFLSLLPFLFTHTCTYLPLFFSFSSSFILFSHSSLLPPLLLSQLEKLIRGQKRFIVLDARNEGVRFTVSNLRTLSEEYQDSQRLYNQTQDRFAKEVIQIASK